METSRLGKTSESIPVVGMGTWEIGGRMTRDSSRDEEAVEALKLGLELGMSLVDTAEMYGGGHSEEVVGKFLEGRRDRVFVASKVSPSHFSYDQVLRSAKGSLERLGVERIDLYQLHWPNFQVPIGETMRAMERLVRDGTIRYIGVSNFSVEQMREAQDTLAREEVVSNQVEYSLVHRAVEKDVLPYCQKMGITLIAYSPLGKGRIPMGRGPVLKILDEIAARHGKSRSQAALSWLLGHDSVVVIPKAIDKSHVRENAAVMGWRLTPEENERITNAFQFE